MNKFLSVLAGLVLVLSGVNYFQLNSIKMEVKESFGAVVRNTQEEFTAGLKAGRTGQFTVSSTGALITSGTITASGASTFSAFVTAPANRGTISTAANGTGTTTVTSGVVCVASPMGATSTISTYASTTGTTLTVKGAPSAAFQYLCF